MFCASQKTGRVIHERYFLHIFVCIICIHLIFFTFCIIFYRFGTHSWVTFSESVRRFSKNIWHCVLVGQSIIFWSGYNHKLWTHAWSSFLFCCFKTSTYPYSGRRVTVTTGFSPATSPNVRINSQNFLTFSLNTFATLL